MKYTFGNGLLFRRYNSIGNIFIRNNNACKLSSFCLDCGDNQSWKSPLGDSHLDTVLDIPLYSYSKHLDTLCGSDSCQGAIPPSLFYRFLNWHIHS